MSLQVAFILAFRTLILDDFFSLSHCRRDILSVWNMKKEGINRKTHKGISNLTIKYKEWCTCFQKHSDKVDKRVVRTHIYLFTWSCSFIYIHAYKNAINFYRFQSLPTSLPFIKQKRKKIRDKQIVIRNISICACIK